MIEHARLSDAFSIRVDPLQTGEQAVRIVVTGPGVALFAANAGPRPADPHAVTPDPVQFLSDCIAQGYFYPQGPGPTSLQILAAEPASDDQTQTWDVAARNLHPGTWRALCNMLVARGMTRIAIHAAGALPCDVQALPYASPRPDAPFVLDYLRPDVETRDRSVEIALHAPPDDGTLNGIYALLTQWCDLLLLGAFPRPGQSPLVAGLAPELAVMSAPDTILQAIDIAFACDEFAFVPLITAFDIGVGRDFPVRQITIR